MEGFLEANRVVEASLSKLGRIHKSGELPLRKTLLISRALNVAQNVATSAHYSLLHTVPATTTSRSSSKLLASISKQVEDSSINESATNGDPRLAKTPAARLPSPIVSCSALARPEDEPMETEVDFESVTNSVISELFSDTEKAAVPPGPEVAMALDDRNNNAAVSHSWHFDVSEARNTSRWTWEPHVMDSISSSPPVSPGKRHHSEAFPFNESLVFAGIEDDPKRFKPTPPHGCPLESLPGFCSYLSPKNLQSAPLITYMFGKGFAEPSDPTTSGWPAHFTDVGRSSTEKGLHSLARTSPMPYSSDNHFQGSVPTSPVKFSPILAF